MKKLKLVLALSSLVILFAACSFGGDSSKKSSDGSSSSEESKYLNVVLASEPPTLDPALATDSTSGAVIRNVFEGLTKIDKDNKVVNAAAKDIKVSDDGLTYTFTLRDANWSNGDKVTAGDFEYAWKRVLNPDTLSEYASNFYNIQGAEAYNKGEGKVDDVMISAIDDDTLEVVLSEPTAYFTQLTAFYTFMPLNQKVVEANDKWAADAGDDYVSNGPFTLDTWKHSDSIKLVKNDKYWGKDDVNLDTVNISMVEDESTANKMFEAGEIDFLGSPYQTVPLDAIDGYKSSGQLNTPDYAAIYFYKVNTTKDFVSNKNIRKALALAIDRENIVTNITKAGQQPALGAVPPAIEGFDDNKGYFKDNDVTEAKKYLEEGMKELGLSDPSEITVDISINTSEAHAAIAQVVQEAWKKNLGINSNIDNSEWKVYLESLNTLSYPGVGRLGWIADYLDPYTFLEMYSTKDNGNNDTGWENDEYKKLIEDSRKEADEDKRIEILKEAETILMDEMPIIPVYFYVNTNVVKDYVSNMVPNGLGDIDLKLVDVNR